MEQRELTNKALAKVFLRYVPLHVVGMLALSCYILADTFFIANGVGQNGLTALNLVLPVYSFISGVGLLFGMGGATQYTIAASAGDLVQARRFFSLTLILGVCTGMALLFAGAICAGPICGVLGADQEILPLAMGYLRMILLFAPAFILNNVLLCFVRNDGAPKRAMAAMLTGSLSNIVLDYLFIFPMQLGMFGAAFATCLAPVISIAVLSGHLRSRRSGLHWTRLHAPLHVAAKIVSVGISSFITEFSSGIVMLVFNFLILSLAGNTGVAAYGIVANINLIAVAIFTGISAGMQPLISRFYGAAERGALKRTFFWAAGLSVLLGLGMYAGLAFFADPLTALFNRNEDAGLARLAAEGIRLYFPLLCMTGVNIVSASLFASVSVSTGSFVISILRSVVFVVGLVPLLSKIGGLRGVWYTVPCTELLTFGGSLVLLLRLNRRQKPSIADPLADAGYD